MMPLAPEALTRYKLNDSHAETVDTANPGLVGITGCIVVETTHTFMVGGGSRVRQVPERGAISGFAIPRTDKTADAVKTPGITSKLRSGTTGGFDASQSDRLVNLSSAVFSSGNYGGVTHVMVDGAQLLSRPAPCAGTTGDSKRR